MLTNGSILFRAVEPVAVELFPFHILLPLLRLSVKEFIHNKTVSFKLGSSGILPERKALTINNTRKIPPSLGKNSKTHLQYLITSRWALIRCVVLI